MEKWEDGKRKNIILNVNQNMRNYYLQEYYHITTLKNSLGFWDPEQPIFRNEKAGLD